MSYGWVLGVTIFLGILAVLGCGQDQPAEAEVSVPIPVPTVVPTPVPPPTPLIVYVEVTPVPLPTPTPLIIYEYVEVTPVPTPTLAVTPTPVPTPTATPEPTLIPTATPAATPTPAPTLRFRTVERPHNAGYIGFRFETGPEINGTTLSFSAIVEGEKGLLPSQLQVWQALRDSDLDQECSTMRPLAFLGEGQGSGVTPYRWSYCSSSTAQPQVYVDDVPWLTADTWKVIHRSSNPFVYKWTVTVSLGDRRVRELMYDRAAGFVLVGFAGETLLTRRWVE